MNRVKTFFIYAILVIIVILLTDFIANLCLESAYRNIEQYEIATSSPKIEITEAVTTNANGRVKGTVKNESNTLMQNLFIKIELLSNIGNVLGTEYLQVGNLQVNQSKEFELRYRYYDVDSFVISTTNEVTDTIIEYNPLVEHIETYFIVSKLIFFMISPSFFLFVPFIF